MNRPRLAVLLLVLSSLSSTTIAQAAGPLDSLQARLCAVKIGKPLRIATRDQRTIQGAYAGIKDGSVVLVDNGDHDVPLDSIAFVWQQRRCTRGRVLIGGLIGASAGLIHGSQMGSDIVSPSEGANILGILYGATGAAVGALTSTGAICWQEIHRADLEVGENPATQSQNNLTQTMNDSPSTINNALGSALKRKIPRHPMSVAVLIGSGAVSDDIHQNNLGGANVGIAFSSAIAGRTDVGVELGLQSYTCGKSHWMGEPTRYTYENFLIRMRGSNRTLQPYLDGGFNLTYAEGAYLSPMIGGGVLLHSKGQRFVCGLSGRYYPKMDRHGVVTAQVHMGLRY
ncbi:MAG: hypothetical protein MUF51_06165 [Vicinamibacteria bacterium]|jgi:hypothetical protein|nr:hypothetical protein [Vicinamibacteria bacterium]